MAATTIQALPNEILTIILNNLDWSTLKQLSPVSRKFEYLRKDSLARLAFEKHRRPFNSFFNKLLEYALSNNKPLSFSQLNLDDAKLDETLLRDNVDKEIKLNLIDYFLNILNRGSELAIFYLNASRKDIYFLPTVYKISLKYWMRHDPTIIPAYLNNLIENIKSDDKTLKTKALRTFEAIIPILDATTVNMICSAIINKIGFIEYRHILNNDKINHATATLILKHMQTGVVNTGASVSLAKILAKYNDYSILSKPKLWPTFSHLIAERLAKFIPNAQMANMYFALLKDCRNKAELTLDFFLGSPALANISKFHNELINNLKKKIFRPHDKISFESFNTINYDILFKLYANGLLQTPYADIIKFHAFCNLITRAQDFNLALTDIVAKFNISLHLITNEYFLHAMQVVKLNMGQAILDRLCQNLLLQFDVKYIISPTLSSNKVFYTLKELSPNLKLPFLYEHFYNKPFDIIKFIINDYPKGNNIASIEDETILSDALVSNKNYSSKLSIIFDFLNNFNSLPACALEYLGFCGHADERYDLLFRETLNQLYLNGKEGILINKTIELLPNIIRSHEELTNIIAYYLDKQKALNLLNLLLENNRGGSTIAKTLCTHHQELVYIVLANTRSASTISLFPKSIIKFKPDNSIDAFRIIADSCKHSHAFELLLRAGQSIDKEQALVLKPLYFTDIYQRKYSVMKKNVMAMCALINYANITELNIFYNAITMMTAMRALIYSSGRLNEYETILMTLARKIDYIKINNLEMILFMVETHFIDIHKFKFVSEFLDIVVPELSVEQQSILYNTLIKHLETCANHHAINILSQRFTLLSKEQQLSCLAAIEKHTLNINTFLNAEISKLLYDNRFTIKFLGVDISTTLSNIAVSSVKFNFNDSFIKNLFFYKHDLPDSDALLPDKLCLPPVPMIKQQQLQIPKPKAAL